MMYPLLVCSIVSLAIIINRLWNFHKVEISPEKLNGLRKLISEKRTEDAKAILSNLSGPMATIIKEGISSMKKGKDAVIDAFERAALSEIPKLEKYLPTLATVASISTLLGFTGTVTGMINAFRAIEAARTSSPEIVARGIWEALITTAVGLIIAIPTVVFHHYFTQRVDKFVLEIERIAKDTTEETRL